MAEERLIDDDKDRKYKIRKNENGEDELVIDGLPEEEDREEIAFEVPDLESDDEEAAVMTPEQLAAREKARQEAESARLEGIASRTAQAREFIAADNFADAAYVLNEAEAMGGSGEIYFLKVRALTKNFTDFSDFAECAPAVENVAKTISEEINAEFAPYKEGVEMVAAELEKEVEALGAENESKKSERAASFAAKKKTAFILFAVTAVPMLISAVLAAYFGANMHARYDHTFMISCFVFIGVAAAFFIATLFTAHKLWDSARLVKLNSKNSSTKLGREYEDKKSRLQLVKNIISALSDDILG